MATMPQTQPTPNTASGTEHGPSGREVLEHLCTEVPHRRERALLRDAAPRPQRLPRASGIQECARRMYLDCKAWPYRPAWTAWILGRFERGRDIEERIVTPRLAEYGFRVIEGQMALELYSRDRSKVICTGHIDGKLDYNRDGVEVRPVFDCKSVNPNLYSRLNDLSDILANHWTRHWVYQLLLYMYANEEPHGLLLLDDCLGHWKLIPVVLDDHLDLCETILSRCEEVVDALEAAEPPAFHGDPAVCRECWCLEAGVCSPELDFSGDGIRVLGDSALAEQLDRMHELRAAGEEYASLDRKLKASMKQRGAGRFVCGEFLIETAESARAKYEVPDDVKQQYRTVGKTVSTKWRRLEGAPYGS